MNFIYELPFDTYVHTFTDKHSHHLGTAKIFYTYKSNNIPKTASANT